MIKTTALVLCLTSAGPLTAATESDAPSRTVRGLRIEYVIVSTATEVTGSVRTSTDRSVLFMDISGRERIESRTSDGALRVILNDVSAETFTELDPASRRASVHRHHSADDQGSEARASGTSGRRPTHPLGTRVIQDLDCEVRGDDRIEVAFCTEPITGLSIIGSETVRLPAAEIRRTIEKVEVLQLDATLFEVPADYVLGED